MSGASSFVHSTTAEAGNGMETRGRAVTNEIARNCFPLAFSFSGPQIKNPYISSIHKDFSISYNLFIKALRAENGTRTRDPQLGKLMLYQLSYCRISKTETKVIYIFQPTKYKQTIFTITIKISALLFISTALCISCVWINRSLSPIKGL